MHFEPRRSGLPRRSATAAAAMAAFTTVWAGLLGTAQAADIKDVACRTTAECLAEAARVRGEVSKTDTSRTAELQDVFYWTNRVNMASTVMLHERGLLDKATAARIADGIQHAVAQASKPGGKRPTDYLQIENIIAEKAGPEATFIHAGRSRQDILATVRVSRLRTAVMDVTDRLLVLRKTLLDIAEQHKDTLVPAYTNGVQAQPITYGHYLLAFADSFARDSARIRELYARLNLSPMGTAVLANSAWPLDRVRLAELLGFDGLVVNSLDAGQIITYDVPLEASGIVSSTAVRIAALLEDVHTQYHQSSPWLLLESGSTYTSSAMPQKQNPGVIMSARAKASDVVAASHWMTLRAHNVNTGMTDYKDAWTQARNFLYTVELLEQTVRVMKSLRLNPARALEELRGDWTTTSELADTLQRVSKVPFRVGHAFATAVVNKAREKGWRPDQFPYEEAVPLYAAAAARMGVQPATLPLSAAQFRQALSHEEMVRTRVGIGGPQPAEVQRQLQAARQSLKQDEAWLQQRLAALAQAEAALNASMSKLANP